MWQNPFQSRDERCNIILGLIREEADPEVMQTLVAILLDDEGLIYVSPDGRCQHVYNKARQN